MLASGTGHLTIFRNHNAHLAQTLNSRGWYVKWTGKRLTESNKCAEIEQQKVQQRRFEHQFGSALLRILRVSCNRNIE